jgi:hypothetical protein
MTRDSMGAGISQIQSLLRSLEEESDGGYWGKTKQNCSKPPVRVASLGRVFCREGKYFGRQKRKAEQDKKGKQNVVGLFAQIATGEHSL